ncbi:YolD-like family protein [Bacillus cihuensis]|uniref:YolD-like family protein n=1 Tax=Bacillus cihuensis TaxID=1208599 RepID=UPI000415EFD3|nr:YolD-like family protein [Bacillus cihuensis]
MAIIDRGVHKKWQPAFMTPELLQAFEGADREYYAEVKPELDEQQFEYMNQVICQSMKQTSLVAITYFRDQRKYITVGLIQYFNEISKTIKILTPLEKIDSVMLEDILDIKFQDA